MECTGHTNNMITSRDQKLLPYHEELKKVGACFGQSGEYEIPMWYALDGATKPELRI